MRGIEEKQFIWFHPEQHHVELRVIRVCKIILLKQPETGIRDRLSLLLEIQIVFVDISPQEEQLDDITYHDVSRIIAENMLPVLYPVRHISSDMFGHIGVQKLNDI